MRISTMEEVIGNQLETVKNAEPSMKGDWGKRTRRREVSRGKAFVFVY